MSNIDYMKNLSEMAALESSIVHWLQDFTDTKFRGLYNTHKFQVGSIILPNDKYMNKIIDNKNRIVKKMLVNGQRYTNYEYKSMMQLIKNVNGMIEEMDSKKSFEERSAKIKRYAESTDAIFKDLENFYRKTLDDLKDKPEAVYLTDKDVRDIKNNLNKIISFYNDEYLKSYIMYNRMIQNDDSSKELQKELKKYFDYVYKNIYLFSKDMMILYEISLA